MTAPLKRFEPFIEVLQEIRDELREMNGNGIGISCSLDSETSNSLDRIGSVDCSLADISRDLKELMSCSASLRKIAQVLEKND